MTKSEKELFIGEYAKYAIEYGYLLEKKNNTLDKGDRISIAVKMDTLSKQMDVLYDLSVVLKIEIIENFTAMGIDKYRNEI